MTCACERIFDYAVAKLRAKLPMAGRRVRTRSVCAHCGRKYLVTFERCEGREMQESAARHAKIAERR